MAKGTDREHIPSGAEEGDNVLEELVRLADAYDLQVGITVYIGGTLISGLLVSGRHFFEGSALRLTQAKGPQQTKARLAKFFKKQMKQTYPSSGEAAPEKTDGKAPVGYIHLKNARPFDAEGPYLREGVWWRGRIDRIDGFNFGVVDDSGPKHPRT